MCIYSHPDVCMHDHVNRILRIAKKSKQDIPLHLLLAMVLHDTGKATKEFQNYLNGGKHTTHALLSAFYTLYVCIEKFKLEGEDCFWSFLYVERHHTNLSCVENPSFLWCYIKNKILNKILNNKDEIKKELKKASSIDSQKFKCFVDSLEIEDYIKKELLFDYGSFSSWINSSAQSFFEAMKEKLPDSKFPNGYFWNRLSEFSLLLDADKSSAALGGDLEEPSLLLSPDSIKQYTKNIQSPLKQLRDEAYKHVFSNEAQGRVFTLTLPTGMGKTLTSLSFALKHKPARVIYALPFLSIIDQVSSNLEKGFGLKIGQDFVVHHHLTEYPAENSEEDHNLFRVMVEGWKAPIILTTFYQLFHTIFPWQNSYIRRLDRLRNSFIILDEVQALPVRYWNLVGKAIEVLTQELNCKVLYMTATQPYFTPGAQELVNVEYY
ncbi:MAG: CRISPR-associated endonuclease Cas3'', partial [Candidatus Parvarchaeota archaeon]